MSLLVEYLLYSVLISIYKLVPSLFIAAVYVSFITDKRVVHVSLCFVGRITHKWIPCHADVKFRSNIDKIIYLVNIGQYYVPITEQGIVAVEPD